MIKEQEIIEECKKYNPMAQTHIYEKYARIFYGVCIRYADSKEEAEDILQEALIKIMTRIKSFSWRGEGSFYNWAKRVVINTAITHINKKKKLPVNPLNENSEFVDEIDEEDYEQFIDKNEISREQIDFSIIKNARLNQDELIETLLEIPEHFRIVFNLHIIEGIKHKEIAKMLDITEKTSKTRLFRARERLQKVVYQKCIAKVGI